MTAPVSWIDHALELHEEGLNILPISKGSKLPMTQWKQWQQQDQTEQDLLDIYEYFQADTPPEWLVDLGDNHGGRPWLSNKIKQRKHWPAPVELDMGIVCGMRAGVVVVDVDNEEAQKLAEELGITRTTMAAASRRGTHYWFKHPGRLVQSTAGVGVTGLDIRGDGGYIRVPPSANMRWLRKVALSELPDYIDPAAAKTAKQTPERQSTVVDLTAYRANSETAEDWLKRKAGGSRISKGERNNTMAQVIGMLIEERRDKDWVIQQAQDLGARYFDHEKYAAEETVRIVESLWDIDKSNHAEKHEEPVDFSLATIGHISDDNSDEFMAALPPKRPAFVETLLEPGKALMVAGYAGSGKSELLMMLLKACCDPTKLGTFVGPWQIQATAKALVLDPENNPHLIADRLKRFSLIGNSGDNLRVIPGSVPGPDGMLDTALNLNDSKGLNQLTNLLRIHDPDIVVFDTVRSHYPGLKENEASEWTAYNMLTQQLCRLGICVVWLHHSNKPGPDGYATEAGSSHALTNISTQIFVKPVYEDQNAAQRKHGIWNDDERYAVDIGGQSLSPWLQIAYADGVARPNFDRVSQISYGKVREANPITEKTYYLGQLVDPMDWRPVLHSTWSKKQWARKLATSGEAARSSDPIAWVSQKLGVPVPLLREWGLNDVAQDTPPALAQDDHE